MAESNFKREPNFFWQGVLILVPVGIMGVLAAATVVKDRAAAEQEMRQRAESLLGQINRDFAARFDNYRLNYELARDSAVAKLENQIFPPGDTFRSLDISDPITEARRADVPGSLLAESGFLFCPAFNADGSMRPRWVGRFESMRPGNEPPAPPAWRAELTPEQAAAWQNLSSALTGSNNLAAVKQAVNNLKQTKPSEDALQNAYFFEERAALDARPTPATVQAMFNTRLAYSETGIPLSSLGVAEALKRADLFPDTRKIQELWDQLVLDARNKPNLLTPELIELAEPLAQRDPRLKECLPALKTYWSHLEDMWAIGESIQQSGQLRGTTPTNFWLTSKNGQLFCVLQPEVERWDDGHGNISTNLYVRSRLFSHLAVEWAFTSAIHEARVSIPPYFGLTCELAGSRPISFSQWDSGNPRVLGPTLAEVEGVDNHLRNAKYTLRIQVADAALMYAAQRQRAMMTGALLLASALAAFIGFFAARRAFYRQLRLNEMKSNFVSSVSHELRAPIASVRLMAEGLERGKIAGAEKQNEYFKFIVQECRRLSSLIENVLDFSRIEQGRKQYEIESTDLVALTGQTVKLMETYAAERQVQIALEVKGDPVPVEIEGKSIQQALVNLIDNAVKHSPKGSGVTVGIDFAVSSVNLWVEDKGEGIPASEHERIFERFYRLGSELRRETQGVGIGLSIVKHIVEAHGGKIIVRSAPGQGSRIAIELPINQKKGQT